MNDRSAYPAALIKDEARKRSPPISLRTQYHFSPSYPLADPLTFDRLRHGYQ